MSNGDEAVIGLWSLENKPLTSMQRLRGLQDLFRPGTDPVVFSKVQPANRPGRIQQKFGRPRDVTAVDPGAGVDQIKAANRFRVWIGKKREGIARLRP